MLSPVILVPAESAMPWDLFIYKATLLADVYSTHKQRVICSGLVLLGKSGSGL